MVGDQIERGKTYDRLEWNFIFETLNKFGFDKKNGLAGSKNE